MKTRILLKKLAVSFVMLLCGWYSGHCAESVEITSWTIAGDPILMGSNWDANDTNNDMTLIAGAYMLEKKAYLTEGNYDYKACANHSSSVKNIPDSGNQTLQIDEDGDYVVTFSMDADGTTLAAFAESDDGTPTVTDIKISGEKYVGETLTFTTICSNCGSDPAIECHVKFGAGNYSFLGDDCNSYTPTAPGKYTVKVVVENVNVKCSKEVEFTVTNKYFAKNSWDGTDWTWKQMKKKGDNIFVLDSVIYGGTGFNINTTADDSGAKWIAETDFRGDKVQAKDTVSMSYNTDKDSLTLTLIGRPLPPVEVTVGESGYATVYAEHKLIVPANVQVFSYDYDSEFDALVPRDTIASGSVLPPTMGFVVKAAAGQYTFNPAKTAAGSFSSDLRGYTEDKTTSDVGGIVFGLQVKDGKLGFYKFTGATIPAGKAVYVKFDD